MPEEEEDNKLQKDMKGWMKKYQPIKRILIAPRPLHDFPDHEAEYRALYDMFSRIYKEIGWDGRPSKTLRFLLLAKLEILDKFPYYKYRLFTPSRYMANIIKHFQDVELRISETVAGESNEVGGVDVQFNPTAFKSWLRGRA